MDPLEWHLKTILWLYLGKNYGILDLEKSRMTAELKLKVYGTTLNSRESSFDMYVSVEKVIAKMATQLKKYKSKLKDRKPREAKAIKQALDAGALTCELEKEE